MVNALIVDDREDFVKQFKAEAKAHNIIVASKTNLKDMTEFLPKNADKLSMIILDIKCLKNPDQELEHEDFLPAALNFLNKDYPHVPRVILTADSVSYSEVSRYHSDEKIYRKTPDDIISLFGLIHEKSIELPTLKIRTNFADVFKIFTKGYLQHEQEMELLTLLNNMNSKDSTQTKNNLVIIRRIQEKTFQVLNRYDKLTVPDNCLNTNGNVNFRKVDMHLKGNKTYRTGYAAITKDYYSGVIELLSLMIYNVASSTSAHNPYHSVDFPPSHYTVRSCTFALLDFLMWFERRMDEAQVNP